MASLKTSSSLALLNFGQNAIFSITMSAAMILAAKQIVEGNIIGFNFYWLVCFMYNQTKILLATKYNYI